MIIAGLIAMVDGAETLPRPLHRFVCRVLRPAESALRRLIVIVATGLRKKAEAAEKGAAETKKPLPDFSSFARGQNRGVFALIDPRKRFCATVRPLGAHQSNIGTPRISLPGLADAARPVKPDKQSQAQALSRRIEKLERALNSLPRQARRLNRLMAMRHSAKAGPGRVGPIRPGHPPGYKKRPRHPVDDLLRECHALAQDCGFRPP